MAVAALYKPGIMKSVPEFKPPCDVRSAGHLAFSSNSRAEIYGSFCACINYAGSTAIIENFD
jgi:hypothetical protein